MNVLLAGCGKLGRILAKKLTSEGHSLTIIDSNPDVIGMVMEQYDSLSFMGNCATISTLKEAGVAKADLLIAVTNEDEINILCCMTAHNLNPNIHTIARIRNPEYVESVYEMRDSLGLSMFVNPERQAAAEIERLLKYPGFLKRESFSKGRFEIVEFRIDEDSKLKNVSLYDLNSLVKCKVLVCAVYRNDTVQIPSGNFVLEEGDRIFVSAQTNELTTFLKNLGIITHKVKRVILCGGSRISYYLAKALDKSGITVQMIEQNREKCVELANALPDASIVHGDATDQVLLESEGIGEVDALVTLTGLDEMNMIISLYGQKRQVPQIITKVSHGENSIVEDTLTMGSVVCPTELCCNGIVRYVRAMQNKSGAALTVHSMADGLVETLEFRVDKDTLHCNTPLKELKLKKNVLLACISRKGVAEVPSGDSKYDIGDTLVVVARDTLAIKKINDIFEG